MLNQIHCMSSATFGAIEVTKKIRNKKSLKK